MADLIKTPDKTEYTAILEDASLLMGGKDVDGLIPNTNLSKWEDEAFLNFNPKWLSVYDKGLYIKSIETDFTNGLLSLTKGGIKWQSYVDLNNKAATEIVFADLPTLLGFTGNQLSFDILKSDGITAHHQPELTAQEIAEGCFRPDDVVNSYAFYFNKRDNKYKTGKFCHIYAPYFIDALGSKIKLEQWIDGNQLIISWAKVLTWLSKAKFPVVLDPLIGDQSCGDTQANINATIYGSLITMGVTEGTGNSIFACLSGWGSGEKVKCAMYLDSDNTLVTNGETEERETGSATHYIYHEFTFGSAPSLAASTDYFLAGWGDSNTNLQFDAISTKRFVRSLAYGAWPDPHGGTEGTENFLFSLYLDYDEVAAGGLAIPGFFGPTLHPVLPLIKENNL